MSVAVAGPTRSRRRQLAFIAFGSALAFALACALAEVLLRILNARALAPQELTEGFLRHDDTLGWRLNPGWSGRHRYAGFDVNYAIDGTGFRPSHAPVTPAPPPRQILFLGDSFTFGVGVNDAETFVALLNRTEPARLAGTMSININAGVPGYSTDQEVLLAEAELQQRTNVSALRLVVCLANDLLDNPRAHPLQAQMAKAHFVLAENRLVLTNAPVPRQAKPAGDPATDLARAMAGPGWHPDWPTRLSRRSALAQLVHRELFGLRHVPVDFQAVQQENLALFWALADRLAAECRAKQVAFDLILMPGSSAVLQPHSLPGRYQRWLGDQLVAGAVQRKWPVVDLLPALEQAAAQRGPPLFLGDGHLSPRGHIVVAEILQAN